MHSLTLLSLLLALITLNAVSVIAFSTRTATSALKHKLSLKVIGKDEAVIFFPTCGYQLDGNSSYILPIHGWIFNPERRSLRRRAFLSLLSNVVDDVLNDDEEEETSDDDTIKELLSRRVNPFIVDNHRHRKITIRLGSNETASITRQVRERSRKNGHFQGVLYFTPEELEGIMDSDTSRIHFEAVTGIEEDERCFRGVSHVLEPTGLSVISDVDDTVKISHVLNKKLLLKHTFLQEFEAVPGMAQLYRKWKEEKQASFHYVSSSPWQLFCEINAFLEKEQFPTASSYALKSIRLKDRSLLNLFADPVVSKLSKISSIIDTYPQRKFVLVGDTGERDPEVYGEICRRYPHNVEKVFLRDVVSDLDQDLLKEINAKQLKKKKGGVLINAPDRFNKAFAGVPWEKWSVFTDASTIDY